MKWYCARLGRIEEVEVVKARDKTITLADGRIRRFDSDFEWYRSERKQAKAAMITEYEYQRNRARKILESCEERLAMAQNA